MSHHPSSAELAAFRRALQDDRITGWLPFTSGADGGAWDHERQHGIGYRDDDWLGGSAAPVGFRYTFARRKASALRSRAYARACVAASPRPCADCGAIGWHTRACPADWPELPR